MQSRKRSKAGVRRGFQIYIGPVGDKVRFEVGSQAQLDNSVVLLTAEEAITLAAEIREVAKHIETGRGFGSLSERGV